MTFKTTNCLATIRTWPLSYVITGCFSFSCSFVLRGFDARIGWNYMDGMWCVFSSAGFLNV